MQYCNKCGAELTKGARFCEKCGTPIEGGNSKAKKKWIIGSCAGIIVILATVAALYFTGVIGGKEKAVQTGGDVVPSPMEAAMVEGATPEPVVATEPPEVVSSDDMAWEAYDTYKAFDEKEKERCETEEDESYGYNNYAFVYIDSDKYPELLINCTMVSVGGTTLYTCNNDQVKEIKSELSNVSFKMYEGLILDSANASGRSVIERVYIFQNSELVETFFGGYTMELSGDDYVKNATYIGEEEVSVKEYEEGLLNYVSEEDLESPQWATTIDEAFTKFMSVK